MCIRKELQKQNLIKKMHKRIQEQVEQQIEKYYEKLPKTIEKQEEWQFHKVDFHATATTNSFALFDDSPRWMFDPGGRE